MATEHTTDKDTTSLPVGRRNAQLHIWLQKVSTILFNLHRAKLILTDNTDDDDNN